MTKTTDLKIQDRSPLREEKGRQGLFTRDGRGTQVRTMKGRSDNETQVIKSRGSKVGKQKLSSMYKHQETRLSK